ncbi:sialic acid-binding Ig-like lectin 13 [Mustelus asterias]
MIGKSYFLLSLLQVGLTQEWKGDIPREVTAQEGLCVQIPCHYTYPSHLANHPRVEIWYKNKGLNAASVAFHSKEHNSISSRFRHRTRLSGDLKDGDCSLVINNVKWRDAGSYYFRIEFDSGNNYNYRLVTRLHVSAKPSKEWKGDTPRKVTVQEGSCVQIPCQYSYPSCLGNQPRVGIWFNNKKQSSSSIAFHSEDHNQEAAQFHNRTRLSGDLKDGDCSLIINSVTRGDAGPYYFRIEFDKKNSYSYHPVTRLHVSDFTDKPTIFPAEIIAGKCVNISCTFNTTCNGTAPVLTWDTPTDGPGSVSNTVTQHGVTLTYTSVLTLIPSPKHHGHNLTCRVRSPSVSSKRILGLTVQYKPEISQKSACTSSSEGITCVCVANSNPPGDLTWHLPHANISGNQTQGRLVSWQVRDGHLMIGSLILLGPQDEEEVMATCSVRNPHGEAMFKVYLWVKDRNSSEWTAGLLTAGIVFSVCVAGILVFMFVRKNKTEERASETSDIALSPRPLSVKYQDKQNMLLTDPQNTTGDTTREGETPTPRDLSEGPLGGDTGHGNPDQLLYANINLSKLPRDDGTAHMSEATEYAQIRFQRK